MEKILKFPEGFLWGTATSAYQVEGGIENNDWAKDFPAGRACDHYNLYEKDFDLLKSLNQNAYRFSIEWSRIEPEEGKFDEKEIEHYKKVILALKERGVIPFLTLHHFTNPLWFAKKGGWENKKSVEYFCRFVEKIMSNFRGLVEFWMTFNEPQVLIDQGYLLGEWPPFKKNIFSAIKVFKNIKKSHQRAFEIIHKIDPDSKAGIVNTDAYFEPYQKDSVFDRVACFLVKYFSGDIFWFRGYMDFLGLNYYQHARLQFHPLKFYRIRNENKFLSDINWEIYPEGIFHVLKDLQKYNLPIFITENGLADAKDKLRKDFIKDHLFWIHRAIQEGVDVRGYFHWSLIDNFEWAKGFEPRFGLIEIDYKTLERKLRPSALYFAKICKENQLPLNPKP